ncbi:MAG: cupin domain-containing protein [Spirochaetales bacterium]|nr:cupin domain-containing protein [Spirochaetales bacterium]
MHIVKPKDGKDVSPGKAVSARKILVKDEVETVHLEIAPGGALPLHTTPVEVFFYVLEGSGEIEIGSERVRVDADTLVESPKMIPHGLYNTGDTPFRVLVVKTPRPQ